MEAGDSWFIQIKVLFQNAGNVFVLLRNKISALPHPQNRMRRRKTVGLQTGGSASASAA
jgi:hypothetical protein